MNSIVIADDDAVFVTMLSEMLKIVDETYTIHGAENGRQAADIIASTPVDLLITDLRMPVMSGDELIDLVSKRVPCLPVIVVSAANVPQARRPAVRCSVKYFDKPVDINELVGTVKTILNNARKGKRPTGH